MWFAYGMMWFSTAIAACVGMYFTHSAWCLWVFIFPACVKMTQGKNSDDTEINNLQGQGGADAAQKGGDQKWN